MSMLFFPAGPGSTRWEGTGAFLARTGGGAGLAGAGAGALAAAPATGAGGDGAEITAALSVEPAITVCAGALDPATMVAPGAGAVGVLRAAPAVASFFSASNCFLRSSG